MAPKTAEKKPVVAAKAAKKPVAKKGGKKGSKKGVESWKVRAVALSLLPCTRPPLLWSRFWLWVTSRPPCPSQARKSHLSARSSLT